MEITLTVVLLTIGSSLVSGLAGVIVSTIYFRRHERRQLKRDALRAFAGNRFDLRSPEFTRALNEVFIVFNDSPDVMAALSEFHRVIVSRQLSLGDDSMTRLFKAMCKDAGVEFSQFNDSFFLTPFNTKTALPSTTQQVDAASPAITE